MIKLPRRPSTTWIRTGDRNRRRHIIRWGQEFPRVLLGIWQRVWKRIWKDHNPNWEPTLGLWDQVAPEPR